MTPSNTATYYIKTAAEDVKSAMTKLESSIPVASEALTDTYRTVKENPQRRIFCGELS